MAEKEEPAANSPGVIPYILSHDAENHLQWLKTVFAATEKEMHRDESSKKILHAALCINGGVIYFSDGSCLSEQSTLHSRGEPRGIMCHLNVEDPADIWKRAVEGGAKVVVELEKQFWGDLYGSFLDPYGYEWGVCACAPTAQEKSEEEEEECVGLVKKEP